MSSAWAPASAMAPLCRTAILWQLKMVESLCATIATVVLPTLIISSSASCTTLSDLTSNSQVSWESLELWRSFASAPPDNCTPPLSPPHSSRIHSLRRCSRKHHQEESNLSYGRRRFLLHEMNAILSLCGSMEAQTDFFFCLMGRKGTHTGAKLKSQLMADYDFFCMKWMQYSLSLSVDLWKLWDRIILVLN